MDNRQKTFLIDTLNCILSNKGILAKEKYRVTLNAQEIQSIVKELESPRKPIVIKAILSRLEKEQLIELLAPMENIENFLLGLME